MKLGKRVLLVLAALAVVVVVAGPMAIRLRESESGRELPPGVAGRFVVADGRRMHVVERGEGPALVLLHGFGGSTFDWEQFVMEPLSRKRRVIAVDLPGFGWSEREPAVTYDYDKFADRLADTFAALGLERAAVAGQSMGGGVAAVFAARHPDRVERLVLVDAVYPQEPGEIALPFRVLRTPVLGELALGLSPEASGPGFDAAHHERAVLAYRLEGTRDEMLRFVRSPGKPQQLAAAYPRIRAPALVIHGTADRFVPYALMERAVPAFPRARVVKLEGGGHFPHRDAPDVIVREVEAFLAE